MRKYITQHVPGRFLTIEQRQTLAADWNELIRAGRQGSRLRAVRRPPLKLQAKS